MGVNATLHPSIAGHLRRIFLLLSTKYLILVGFDPEDLVINDLKNFVYEANSEMSGEIIPKWKDLMMYGAAMEQGQDDVSIEQPKFIL